MIASPLHKGKRRMWQYLRTFGSQSRVPCTVVSLETVLAPYGTAYRGNIWAPLYKAIQCTHRDLQCSSCASGNENFVAALRLAHAY